VTRLNRAQATHRAQVRLQRSLSAIVIGSRQAERKLKAELAPLQGGDVTQVVHVPVTGKAGGIPTMTELTIGLPQRIVTRIVIDEDDVQPVDPTFAEGFEMKSDTLVELRAYVRDWIEDDSGLIEKVRVRLTAYSPGATTQLPFAAVAHLSFTGLAAPDGDDDDQGNAVPETPDSIPQQGGGLGGTT